MKGRDTNNVRAVQHFDAHIIKLEREERKTTKKKERKKTKGLLLHARCARHKSGHADGRSCYAPNSVAHAELFLDSDIVLLWQKRKRRWRERQSFFRNETISSHHFYLPLCSYSTTLQ